MHGSKLEFISGLAGGAATTLVMHPLDLIKVRLQVSVAEKGVSLATVVRPIWNAGILEAYRGLAPNFVGNTFSWGAYFMLFHELSPQMNIWPASFISGFATSLVTNPIWVVKTRMLASQRSNGGYSSSWACAKAIYNEGRGILAFWRGFVPGLFGIGQAALQFSLYHEFKLLLLADNGNESQSRLTTAQSLGASALSKSLATALMYPYQVVRARMQMNLTAFPGTIRALYRGLFVNLLRVTPATCITFLAYEKTNELLSDEQITDG